MSAADFLRTRGARALALGVLLGLTGLVYATRLGVAPAHLMHDEVNFALQGHAIASTGHDTNGRFLPVYFAEEGFEAGRDPVAVYGIAAALSILPLSEAAVRLPTAVAGVVSVLLMYLVGRRMFRSSAAGLAAAALLALTPAYFINSRLALSILYPVPFMLGWLLCLSYYSDNRRPRALVTGSLLLGLGVYSYLGGLLMMPLYLFGTLALLRPPRAHVLLTLVAFAAALVPLVAWQAAHPDRYADLLSAYRAFDGTGPVSSFGPAEALRQRINVFWMFFNPDYLFLSGDSRITNSTRQAGLFPLAFALLIPLGVIELARGRGGRLGWLVLAGLLTAPTASAISGRLEINRVLFGIPFGVLAAGFGIQFLVHAEAGRARRWLAAALVAAVPLQFGTVYADYNGGYRVRSLSWFGGDMRGAVERVLTAPDAGRRAVYLNRRTPIERYWRFYAIARGQVSLETRPTYYEPDQFDPGSAPVGSLLVCESGVRFCGLLASSPRWRLLGTFEETPDGGVFKVFERY